jgi:hypothetical protein
VVAMTMRALLVTIALPACLLKPSPPGNGTTDASQTSDGHGSGSGSGSDAMNMVPRVIANAYYGGSAAHSPNMTSTGYSISTTGVHDGDLLLLIANIDNGEDFEIPAPPNFATMYDDFYGTDGQTYFVAYKIANGEADTYQGDYVSTGGSQMGAMTLVAIAGADPVNPINDYNTYVGSDYENSPVLAPVTTASDATTVDNCLVIVAAGADWENTSGGTDIVEGFTGSATLLTELTDQGSAATTLEWTSQTLGYFTQAGSGSLGTNTINIHADSAEMGEPWGVVIAVAPVAAEP